MRALSLRIARESDRPAVQRLTEAAYAEYEALLPPVLWRAYHENIATTLATVPMTQCLVATRAATIAGSVLFSPPDPAAANVARIRLLAVAPAARGAGVAARLMEECLDRARGAAATGVELHTTTFMTVARRMYERRGFLRRPEQDFPLSRLRGSNAGPATTATADDDPLVMGYHLQLAATP